jgi:tRNA threonylcarbamoyladenosine biosynthesis protein TsaB
MTGSTHILAIDTSGREGSLALGRYTPEENSVEVLVESRIEAEREQAARLIPQIQGLLGDQELGASDLGGLLVGAGPGSFTGIRVGVGTAKGMAWALDLPLWAFSSLAGAAAAVEQEPIRPRAVLFDARGDRLYAAAYRITGGTLETLLEPCATTVYEVLDRELIPPGSFLLGDGAVKHRDLLVASGDSDFGFPLGGPSARGLLQLLSLYPSAVPLKNPGRWEPDYLRETGAVKLPKYAVGGEGRGN